MNPEKRALEVMGLGLLIVVGVYFQVRQIRRDLKKAEWPPRRLYIPLAFSALTILGFLFLGILRLIDTRMSGFDLDQFFSSVGRAIVFALLLNSKALLAPAFVAYSLGDTLYCWCDHDELRFWTMLSGLIDWLFEGFSQWLKFLYLSAAFAYALMCALIEEVIG